MSRFKKAKIKTIEALVAFLRKLNFLGKHGSRAENFLVISTTGVGDTLMGIPAIRALRETYKHAFIGVLTNRNGEALLRGNPDIDIIFTFQRGLMGTLSLPLLLHSLRSKTFDTAFIFHASDRIIWPIAFLSGVEEIIGTDLNNKGLDSLLTTRIKHPDTHGIEARLAIVNLVGASTENRRIDLYLDKPEKKRARAYLTDKEIDPASLVVGMHPGAKDAFKCWPSDNFIEAGNALTEKYHCRIIITGSSGEKTRSEEIASAITGAESAAGRLSLRDTAALISEMDLFITNDTGPMHIAFAVKTPTLALFSPTIPRLCGPYDVENALVLKKPVTCSPCIGKKCREPVCMEQITVQEVLEKVDDLIKSM